MKETIKEIWEIMPKRFQGMIMGMLIFFLVSATSELLRMAQTDIILIDLPMALLFIIGVLKVASIIYPWLMNN